MLPSEFTSACKVDTWRGKAKREKQGVEGPEDRKGDLRHRCREDEYSLGGSVITERLYIDGKQDIKKKVEK